MSDNKQIDEMMAFIKTMQESTQRMMPQLQQSMQQVQQFGNLMQPKLIKECAIDRHKCKVILLADDSVRIEFQNKEHGKKYFDKCQ